MNLKKLDKAFSEYIRQKNAEDGICTCISCGKKLPWKEMDAGHYINRKHLALRWNEINVQPQCRACNRFDEGNIPAFGLGLQNKYGEHIIKNLLASKKNTMKYTQYEIDIITQFYKNAIYDLRHSNKKDA
jgi:hypothetical protein